MLGVLHDETRGPKRFIVLGVPDCKTVNSLVNSFSSSPSASRDRPPVRPVHVSFAGLGVTSSVTFFHQDTAVQYAPRARAR